jgi:hypothetical protein
MNLKRMESRAIFSDFQGNGEISGTFGDTGVYILLIIK